MRKLVWVVVAALVAVWSGLAWLAHSVIGVGGNLAATNVDVIGPSPEAVEWLSWLALFGTGVGEWLVIGLWATGALFLLALGFAGNRLLPFLPNALAKVRGTP